MEKEKTKGRKTSKPQDTLIAAVITVAAAIAFIGGYALASDFSASYYNFKGSKTKSVAENSDIQMAGATLGGNSTLGFNENYVVTSGAYDYKFDLGTYASLGDAYIYLGYGKDKSEIRVTKYYYDNNNREEYTMHFNKNVVDIHMTTYEADTNLNTILFLLEDGSVEYMFAETAIENDNYVTQGKIAGLENIVKFYKGTACEKGTPICNRTSFAQSLNGKIYNVYDYIR